MSFTSAGSANVEGGYPPAYLLTFTTYGTWLHGDVRGSVDRKHGGYDSTTLPVDVKRRNGATRRMKSPPFTITPVVRAEITKAIVEVCEHRDWRVEALNVRTNHVHIVVSAPTAPELVMNTLKAWATRRCREARLVAREQQLWTRHGSTRYLWNERAIDAAAEYVAERQGSRLPGSSWPPVPLAHGRGSDSAYSE